jgi:hypothetical protein
MEPSADAIVAADREEPAADPLRPRQRIPDLVDRCVVRSAEPDRASFPGRDPGAADLPRHGFDLTDDLDR